jgi:hypothetical protein
MDGATHREKTGAVGNELGKVENVAPVVDREMVFDGSGDSWGAATKAWAVLSDDTDNLTTDLSHVLGTHSIEFDKVNGAGNTKFAGVAATTLDLDLSRFLVFDRVEATFQLSSIADVVSVRVRLGTDASNYNEWTMPWVGILAGAWNTLSMEIMESSVAGNGWNPEHVKYGAFVVEFGAETDALADVLLDNVVVRTRQAGEKRPDEIAVFPALTAPPEETGVVDVRCCSTHTVQYSIANINANVDLIVWGSIDGENWFVLASWTVLSSQPQVNAREISGLSVSFMKFEFEDELGGTTAEVTFTYRGGRS